MSPERCCGKPLRLKSDIWQIGCVLYYLMTMKHPFYGQVNTSILIGLYYDSSVPTIIDTIGHVFQSKVNASGQ